MSNMEWIIGIVSGLISGTIVTGVFYYLAGRDLAKEAKKLRRIIGLVIRASRDEEAEVVYDDDGSPVSLNHRLKVTIQGTSMIIGNLTVTHKDSDGNVIEER